MRSCPILVVVHGYVILVLLLILRYYDTAVFVLRPTIGRVWHKAVLGGSGRRARPNTCPAFPKMPTAPSAFHLLGAPQTSGNNPPRKPGGKAPLRPKEVSRCRDTLGRIRAAVNTADRGATRQLERCSIMILRYLSSVPPPDV